MSDISEYDEIFDIYSKPELYSIIRELDTKIDTLRDRLQNADKKITNLTTGPLLFAIATAAAILWFKTPQKTPRMSSL